METNQASSVLQDVELVSINNINDEPSANDTFYDDLDFDPDAELERQLARNELILKHQIVDQNDPTKPNPGRGPIVYIGFDSEFVSGSKDKVSSIDNEVLSLQFYLVGECGTYQRVFYPSSSSKRDRPKLSKLIIQLLIEATEAGVILEWPSRVVICGFFLRIDLPAFGDLVAFKTMLDSAAGKITTIRHDYKLEPDAKNIAKVLGNKSFVATDFDGICRALRIRFVDVGSHVDMGTSIRQMGDQIGLPKLAIPEGYSIERMDKLLLGNKQAFEEYGIRDAEIAVKYFLKLQEFAKSLTGENYLPATASSLGVAYFCKLLDDSGIDFNTAFGVTETSSAYWDVDKSKGKGGIVTRKKKVATNMRAIFEPFTADCYSGGRNECYQFGPSEIVDWNDFDLAGAYTTGLVDLRHIDYDNFRVTHTPSDFVGHVLGFAYVEFAFPENTCFPCLPVRNSNNSLFFPLKGFSYCTAPEIEVALNLGCDIKIKYGIVIPWLASDDRLFEPFVTKIRSLRKLHDKGSPDELYAKLLGNSLYGKTAQGLKKKNVFDTRNIKSIELPPSKLTNAAIAAHTTGFIRAVLGEIVAGVPAHRSVISATTDGFITDAALDELNLSGPMAQRFNALCVRVAPDKPMLERKHQVKQVVAVKTRSQMTGVAIENEPLILAKGGISPPPEIAKTCETPEEVSVKHNDYMLELFLNRKPGDITLSRPFTPIRVQWEKDSDVVRATRETLLNMEFDFKRQLLNPNMQAVSVTEHIALKSSPWPTLQEAERARAIFDGWRRHRCLKTLEDWYDFDDHYQFSLVRDRLKVAGKKSGIRDSGNGTKDVFRRLFLRAYTQELCGLTKSKTNVELAAWLTQQGYPTTTDELKNAKRAPFIEHVIPRTERMEEFALLLCDGYPNIEINKFFEINLKD